jgi:uncharacterized membrane protein YqjE
MNRHPLRWDNLIFGLLFLVCVGNWAVWKQDLLTSRELGLTASGVLIVLGVIGVIATLWRTRPARPTSTDTPEGIDYEEADSQP